MLDESLDKKTHRTQALEKRKTVDSETRRLAGKAVCKQILDSPINLLLRTWQVCIYLSTKHEIPTRYIARRIWDVQRGVSVPAWSLSEQTYRLYTLTPRMRLISGHHGIREPAERIPLVIWDVDAFIVPGLLFDKQGGRLGYGAGYYDKILSKARKNAIKIGVCYDWQLTETPLPQEAHDIPMNWIVTDKQVVCCASSHLPR